MSNLMILGIDFETTGLSAEMDQVIEVGIVLWDADRHRPVLMEGFLVQTLLAIPEEVAKLTGITAEILKAHGMPRSEAFKKITNIYMRAEAICAHNGTNFDKLFWEKWASSESFTAHDRLWIDTYIDLPVPGGRLIHMAAEHGFLNPFPHMACTDVLTMLRIVDTYDIFKIIERARIPNVTVIAQVSYDDREKAKARSYKWRPETKSWIKSVKQNEVEKEQTEAGFRVLVER